MAKDTEREEAPTVRVRVPGKREDWQKLVGTRATNSDEVEIGTVRAVRGPSADGSVSVDVQLDKPLRYIRVDLESE